MFVIEIAHQKRMTSVSLIHHYLIFTFVQINGDTQSEQDLLNASFHKLSILRKTCLVPLN